MNATPAAERPWIAGALLIALGLVLLAVQLFQPRDAGWIVLGSISILLLAFFAVTRTKGFLITGAILGGLAVGVGLEEAGYTMNGGVVVLGLAAGFLAIYVVDLLVGRNPHWWPVIPGGILAVVGGTQALAGTEAANALERWWPVALIVVGVVVLVAGQRQMRTPKQTQGDVPTQRPA